jgi:hypothetical protein
MRSFDYSVGPLPEVMDRHGVEAAWIVRGWNRVPTTGARILEGVEVLALFASSYPVPAGPGPSEKLFLSLALVDRDGTVLYYASVDLLRTAEQGRRDRPATGTGAGEAVPYGLEEGDAGPDDLREAPFARRAVRAALAGYRAERPR